jgi:hypothetical protein
MIGWEKRIVPIIPFYYTWRQGVSHYPEGRSNSWPLAGQRHPHRVISFPAATHLYKGLSWAQSL